MNAIDRRALSTALAPDADEFHRLLSMSARVVDWRSVWERAVAHKVGALLAARVEAAGIIEDLPVEVREPLSTARDAARQRHEAALRTLTLVADHFGRAGVPFFLVKGCILVEHVYADASLRRFHDLDVVVRPQHVRAAEQILRELHFGLNGVAKLLDVKLDGRADEAAAESIARQTFPSFHYQIEMVPRDRALVPIDLHWQLAPPTRLRLSAEQLWSHTRLGTIGGRAVHVLEPAAALVHAIVHAMPSWPHTFRLLHLVDVAWALSRTPVPPEDLWRVARKWRVDVDVGSTLQLVADVFELDLSPLLQDHRVPMRQRWFGQVCSPARLFDGGASPPSGTSWQRRRREIEWALAQGTLTGNLVWAAHVRRARRLFLRQRRQPGLVGN